jgi:predicted transcriptional regulator
MSLSLIKQEILETMLLNGKPTKATEIAKQAQKEFQPTMMHILGLIRMGYVNSPEKGLYVITPLGKRILGLPEVSSEKAATIIAYQPHDKSFEFYSTVGQPLNLHAHSLKDFANKLERADAVSIEFHGKRGDFDAWLKGLGDEELAKKASMLRKANVSGEDLRKCLRDMVEHRYVELAKLAGQEVAAEPEHAHTH